MLPEYWSSYLKTDTLDFLQYNLKELCYDCYLSLKNGGMRFEIAEDFEFTSLPQRYDSDTFSSFEAIRVSSEEEKSFSRLLGSLRAQNRELG